MIKPCDRRKEMMDRNGNALRCIPCAAIVKREQRNELAYRARRRISDIESQGRQKEHYERIQPSTVPAYSSSAPMRMPPERMARIIELARIGKVVIAR